MHIAQLKKKNIIYLTTLGTFWTNSYVSLKKDGTQFGKFFYRGSIIG